MVVENLIEFVSSVDQKYMSIILSMAVGVLIGIEREGSNKMAGVRTFGLVGLTGGILSVLNIESLIIGGMLFVIVIALLMGLKDISQSEDIGLSLTTSVALLLTYISGLLIGFGEVTLALIIAVSVAALLVSKNSIHKFAGEVTRQEFLSALQFLSLSVIIYPFLPTENIGPWESIDLQLVWLLVVAVSGLGFVNYILVKKYKQKGFIATGFFGGLVNSTAIIGTIADKTSSDEVSNNLGVSAVLLANSAMALRNAIIAIVFIPSSFIIVSAPLFVISVIGITASYFISDWSGSDIDVDELKSPFDLKNVVIFAVLFLIILVVSAASSELIGKTGFYVTMFLAGLVSSGTSTTSSVTLIATSQVALTTGVFGILIGTGASIIAKIFIISTIDKSMVKSVTKWSFLLVLVGIIASLITYIVIVL